MTEHIQSHLPKLVFRHDSNTPKFTDVEKIELKAEAPNLHWNIQKRIEFNDESFHKHANQNSNEKTTESIIIPKAPAKVQNGAGEHKSKRKDPKLAYSSLQPQDKPNGKDKDQIRERREKSNSLE